MANPPPPDLLDPGPPARAREPCKLQGHGVVLLAVLLHPKAVSPESLVVVVTVVVVVQRSGIFVSLNQQRHVALVKWRYPMYRRSW